MSVLAPALAGAGDDLLRHRVVSQVVARKAVRPDHIHFACCKTETA
jgi:hypothetical protein